MTTWTPVVTDTFTRSDTSTGAAGTSTGAGNGWIDVLGGTWNIASNKLHSSTTDTGGYINRWLLRPSSEAVQDQKIRVEFVAASGGKVPGTLGLVLRAQGSVAWFLYATDTLFGSQFSLWVDWGGGASNLAGSLNYVAMVAGTTYAIEFSAVGVSPTTLTVEQFNLSSGTPAVPVATTSITNSEGSLQNATGVPGLMAFVPGGFPSPQVTDLTKAITYSGSAGGGGGGGSTITSLTPDNVTAMTTGNSIAVVGTGLTGTTFTATGGLGAWLSAQTINSDTSATLTVSPGEPANGNLTITNSGGGTATLTVNTPSAGTLNLGWIGDSITAGTNGNAVNAAGTFLVSKGYTVNTTNWGAGGTTSAGWADPASLSSVISGFTSAGVQIIHLVLGTNDFRTPNNFTVAQHVANMRAIVKALVGAGFKIVLSKPIYTVPNALISGVRWYNDINDYYDQSWKYLVGMVDGVRVFVGDTGAHQAFKLDPATLLEDEGIHPRNDQANAVLGKHWALGILSRHGPLAARWQHY